jgi:hypothetical protein
LPVVCARRQAPVPVRREVATFAAVAVPFPGTRQPGNRGPAMPACGMPGSDGKDSIHGSSLGYLVA